ncbi:SLAF1 protein, partial [Cettia cetti]|nr:SLAF1 protein [Cettia cetti]
LEGRQRKKFLLRLSGGNSWALEPGRLRFHSHDFSLEILNTSREDRRLYEFSVSGGDEEEVWQVQLEVLEPVARASVRILARDESNGSCSVSLRCSAERGDAVSFSWARGDSGDGSGDGSGDSGDSGDRAGDSGDSAGDSGDSAGDRAGPCSGSGPVLNLSLPARGAPFGCVCTARNPVSSARAAFRAWPCGA